ncbi:TetR/AcrR family transcriptional regulator [Sphaerisporangium fuscum]|uniref:TetR/AcrR family transcriptional regulator n=1 Tax=Sphaerisporangium fuscum TaxID=2835868 RepID=UPI0027E35E49|nr:TetR/AcrR family transcriptional regulator [Sphaerisporangium fuscum]
MTTARATPSRRGRPGYDLESLLAVAVKVFNERGYEATSMEDLSRRLGITKSAIYYHVTSKDELLRLAVDRALDGLFEAAAEVTEMEGRAIDKLERLVRSSVRVLVERLPFVTLLLRVRGNTKVERQALARRREFDHMVGELVQLAGAEGDVRPGIDPAVAGRMLFGLVNSLTEWYRPRGGMNADTLADAVCEMAFNGLRRPPSET